MNNFEEGDICPTAYCAGVLELPKVENCSCHISPPCGACTDNKLTCTACGEEIENEEPPVNHSVRPKPFAPFAGHEYKIGEGKRLYNVFYDGSSGSTMVFRGKIEGNVTKNEIYEKLGDGTFGHRGPHIIGDTFTYTKITD